MAYATTEQLVWLMPLQAARMAYATTEQLVWLMPLQAARMAYATTGSSYGLCHYRTARMASKFPDSDLIFDLILIINFRIFDLILINFRIKIRTLHTIVKNISFFIRI